MATTLPKEYPTYYLTLRVLPTILQQAKPMM